VVVLVFVLVFFFYQFGIIKNGLESLALKFDISLSKIPGFDSDSIRFDLV